MLKFHVPNLIYEYCIGSVWSRKTYENTFHAIMIIHTNVRVLLFVGMWEGGG